MRPDIRDAELSLRAVNFMINAGIRSYEELASLSEEKILSYGNVGRKTLKILNDALARVGMVRQPSAEPWTEPTREDLWEFWQHYWKRRRERSRRASR
jgi:DNA-directed RNA polymerase alpha subunit